MPLRRLSFGHSTEWTTDLLTRSHYFGLLSFCGFEKRWFEEVINCTLDEIELLQAVSDEKIEFSFEHF